MTCSQNVFKCSHCSLTQENIFAFDFATQNCSNLDHVAAEQSIHPRNVHALTSILTVAISTSGRVLLMHIL